MVDNEDTTGHAESIDNCSLRQSQRNRYFHGKLLSARDMQDEQRYYRGLYTRNARHVSGHGVVEGLEAQISPAVDSDADFEVTIDAGYAIDRCGRPIVVPEDDYNVPVSTEETIDDELWLYLEYDECVLETVPVAGSEDACEEDCEYNRVLEDFDVRVASPTGDEDPNKPIPPVEFPRRDDVTADTDAALATIAHEFEGADDRAAGQAGNAVFLGVYQFREDGWRREDPGDRVYTNDMLYAATARHTADFENPHQVTLGVEEADDGVSVFAVDDRHSEPTVDFVSGDGSVALTREERTVDLSVASYIEEEVAARTDVLEEQVTTARRHAKERSFMETDRVFREIPERLGAHEEEAMAVASLAREAVDARLRADSDAEAAEDRRLRENGQFREHLTGDVHGQLYDLIYDEVVAFAEVIEPIVTNRSFQRLQRALARLEDALDAEDSKRFAPAQDDIAYAAQLLTPLRERFNAGDYVLDREDPEADPAVVIHARDIPIDDWVVYAEETVEDQNPDYEPDEPVVIVVYEHLLDAEWESWTEADAEELFDEVTERSIKFHAFPESRLEYFEPDMD